jgi:hypothetical protein
LFVPQLLGATRNLRLTRWALMAGGVVGFAVFLVVLTDHVWSLLFGRSAIVFRSSSRVSDTGRWYGALRSRAGEGLPSASKTDNCPLPF